MKKTFNRLLAATVAIPVALSSVLAISSTAAEDPTATQLTAAQLLKVNPETGFPTDPTGDTITYEVESDWNTVVNEQLSKAAGKTISLDAKSIVNGLSSTNYYANLVKEIVNASADPTATVTDGVITITGTANVEDYLAPELADKLAERGYEDTAIDTSIMKDITYTAVITTDLATGKEASVALSFKAGGKDYTVANAADYMDAVYDSLAAQVEAAVDQKVKDLAAEYNITEDEVRANADFGIDDDLAAFNATTDKLAAKIQAYTDKLAKFSTLSAATKTFDTADEALAAALKYAQKQGIASAASVPNTVSGLVASYGNAFNNAVASVNSSLSDAGINVEIAVSASDLASIANGASNVTVGASAGTYTATFEIEDAEYDDVYAYVEDEVADKLPDKEVESVETVKTVTVTASATGDASFDVVRDVTVVLKDKETTTTTTTDEADTTETTVATDGSGDSTETTVATDGSGDSTETTAVTDGSGDSTDTTTVTDGSGSSTETETTTSTNGGDIVLPANVTDVAVKAIDAEEADNIYLSYEDAFDATDLIESVTLTLDDGTTQELTDAAEIEAAIGFAKTPGELYATVEATEAGKVYYDGAVGLTYKPNTSVTVTVSNADEIHVGVALKGDTNLDGKVTPADVADLAYYEALAGANETPYFNTLGKDATGMPVKLAYLASDIDTESKKGEDTDDARLRPADMTYILIYEAYNGANIPTTWEQAISGKVDQ